MSYKCHNCGKPTPLHLLDAKPQSLAGVPATSDLLWDRSHEDFTRLECRNCYGPAWCEGVPS